MMSIKKLKLLRGCAVSVALFCCALILCQVGCAHKKTNRGHLFRCDWAFEYNRTPWIGCPPDSGCDDDRSCKIEGCKKKGCNGCNQKENGFRRHCGISKECTAKDPCCRTLGCGMWIDPTDPNSFAAIGGGVKACGLTPFCSPMKPCGLTPFCGRPTGNRQTLMLGNNGTVYTGMVPMPGAMPISNGTISPTPVQPQRDGTPPKPERKAPVVAGPNGLLISMGIVPGVSTISTGGIVAATGVVTPYGVMTPSGVQLPNGTLNNQVVLKACAMNPACNAGRPCGMTPGCGMMVPVAMVSNNAMMLASALNAPGVAGGVMQAGGIPVGRVGNGTIVNPITGLPVSGLTMNGAPQMGYPPMGYTATGYSPKYPRYDGFGMSMSPEEEEEEEAPVESPITKSQMPVPRFHPVPSKPAFQRSEGMPVTPKTTRKVSARSKTTELSEDASSEETFASSDRRFSKEAVEQAYLEGMSAAMTEMEEELDAQAQERENARMQAQVLLQAKQLQAKMDAQQEVELQRQQEQQRRLRAEQQARLREHQQLEREQLQAAVYAAPAQVEQAIRTVNYYDAGQDSVRNYPMPMNSPQNQARPQARTPQTQTMQARKPVPKPTPKGDSGMMQSARSFGNELISPFTGLWSSNTRKPGKPANSLPVRHALSAPPQHSPAQYASRPAAQHVHAPYSQAICPPQTPKASIRNNIHAYNDAVSMEPDGNLSQNVPTRPPTLPAKHKKVIESEDDGTDSDSFSLVRQAHYVDRD